ncbi:MAG: hypothetical protein KIT86_01830 [Hydrogenophaga sp.]|uniref:hypothetical protein n=1 Tax=Hydrogenophaga sp. TaxID=1904254 RepID=UPI002608E9AE|nr:hypothetical protein [Hydrogenophaga sp.]MCW5668368.1 hypothetical protein [Hydrogenophaga sp.]
MSNNLPALLLVDAMVGATAYTPALHESGGVAPSLQAMDHVRRAQVDVYCSHDSLAISAIREARRALHAAAAAAAGVADALVALDEASWFIRHHEFLRAEDALETALDLMRAMSDRTPRVS